MPAKVNAYADFVKARKGGKGPNFMKECGAAWAVEKKKKQPKELQPDDAAALAPAHVKRAHR